MRVKSLEDFCKSAEIEYKGLLVTAKHDIELSKQLSETF